MTVYVDDPMPIGGKFNNYCHMWSDHSLDELHTFACSIGMKLVWFQDKPEFPHYDLSPNKRREALKAGAVYKSLLQWIKERRNLSSIKE